MAWRVQVPKVPPVTLAFRVMVPLGGLDDPTLEVSVTVTVRVVCPPGPTEVGLAETLVVVVRLAMVIVAVADTLG